MKCPKCGNVLPEDSLFCQYCGTNIAEEPARIAEEKRKSEEAARIYEEKQNADKNTSLIEIKDNGHTSGNDTKEPCDEVNQPTTKKEKTNNATKKWKVIAIIAILLAIISVVLLFLSLRCEHEYKSAITKESTCVAEGELTYACAKCGKSYMEKLPFGEHNYIETVQKEPTCTEKGGIINTCSVCGDSYKEELEAKGHVYDEKILKKATCTTDGKSKFTCSLCNKSYEETVKATGHKEVKDAAVDATCITAGKTEGSHCSNCNEIIIAQKIIPAIGHNNVNGVCSICSRILSPFSILSDEIMAKGTKNSSGTYTLSYSALNAIITVNYTPATGYITFMQENTYTYETGSLKETGNIRLEDNTTTYQYAVTQDYDFKELGTMYGFGIGTFNANSFTQNSSLTFNFSYSGSDTLRKPMEEGAASTLNLVLLGTKVVFSSNNISVTLNDLGFKSY